MTKLMVKYVLRLTKKDRVIKEMVRLATQKLVKSLPNNSRNGMNEKRYMMLVNQKSERLKYLTFKRLFMKNMQKHIPVAMKRKIISSNSLDQKVNGMSTLNSANSAIME